MASYADDLALAHLLADTADSISMARFRALDLRVEAKPDLTPVSDADTAVEKAIRGTLSRARPRDGVLGEEFGMSTPPAGQGNRHWVIDPIDGTKNFIRGVPVWGTLIALMEGERPVAGLVSAPALGRRWWGAVGHGAFADGTSAPPTRSPSPPCASSATPASATRACSAWEEAYGSSRCSASCVTPGAAGPTATSTATCCSPRAPSTSWSSPSCRSGTSRR
nr:hypothetical protein GCM10020092_013680 [Actinoplanes digitatis]